MKSWLKKLSVLAVALTMVFSTTSVALAADAKESSSLTLYDSTTTFRHFDFTLNADNSFQTGNPSSIVNQVLNTKVIENSYIKATFLPDYGARLISLIYKPTGKELLYQNPVGTPYGINEYNFYYNWLMVYGGIMPTFSEPEHGKYWLTPWSYQVVAQDSEKISIQMTKTDDVNFAATPGKFDNGATGITCKVTYTVYADKPTVEMKINLKNNKNQAVKYEYWTCNTLAPGSTPGNTVGSSSMEIVAPMTEVKSKDDWWPWMATVDDAVDASNHIFNFDNLAHFSNWDDMGIAYANDLSDNWWGVINHDNEQGILRIADNANATPGMKLWTWGHDQSYAVNPETSYGNSARPYIELWGGNSFEFFADATLQPLEEKEWTEYYTPTVGLSQVTKANQNAAAYLTKSTSGTQATFDAKVNTTLPGKTIRATMKLIGSTNYTLLDTTFTAQANNAQTLTANADLNNIAAGSYTYQLELKDSSNQVLLVASIPFTKSGGGTSPDLPSATWYLYNQNVSGTSPSGQNLQTTNSGLTGWQPIREITSAPAYWYSPELNGTYAAGNWDFTLWSSAPAGASNVTVELYKTDLNGGNATLIGSQTKDVSLTGTGNHPSQYTFSNVGKTTFSGQRLMVKITKASGASVTMAYNTNDFPTRLVTP